MIADAIRDTYITVVATGSETLLSQTGQPLAIVGAEEIEAVQGADIARIAERLPGVTFTRNGGPGSFTGLRVRGADAEQLLVLVDGLRVADAASPAGGFDFGTLLPAGIRKIELLRGSNSTIWGNQAMGGVLAVETGGFTGKSVSAEFGGPESVYAQGSAGKGWGSFIWGIDGAYTKSRGISAAASGSEPDGFEQWQTGGHAEVALVQRLRLKAALRHVEARLELDGYPAPDYLLADTAEYQDTRRTDASAGLSYFDGGLSLDADYLRSETARDNFDPALGSAPSYTTRSRTERAELRGRWAFSGPYRLYFGAESEWSAMATLYDPRRSTAGTGAYAQFGYSGPAVTLNAGLRFDRHDGFGEAWSLGADGAVDIGNGWRLRASYGEGFKVPTLFQLLSDYGNAALRPERSRAFDAGIELGDRNGWAYFAASLFRRDSSDLIDFVSCYGASDGICTGRPYGTYDNVGRARAQGIELEGAAELVDGLRVGGAWSYVEAANRTPGAANEGKALARRPRHALTLSADWLTPVEALSLGADLRVVSKSFDDAANAVPIEGYEVLTIRASLPIGDIVELYGRVENVWDEGYQTAAGYGSPGRSAYAGVRARW